MGWLYGHGEREVDEWKQESVVRVHAPRERAAALGPVVRTERGEDQGLPFQRVSALHFLVALLTSSTIDKKDGHRTIKHGQSILWGVESS